MARKKDHNLEKVTLNIRKGDKEWLAAHLESVGSTLGWTTLIRNLVAARVDEIKATQAAASDKKELQEAARSLDLDTLISGV